jgi:hypothetical protein
MPDQGAILSAVDDYAAAVSADAVAAQKATDDQALAAAEAKIAELQAIIDADTPDPTPTPPPPPVPTSSAVLGASLGQALPVAQTLPAVRYYSAKWSTALQVAYKAGTRVFVISTKDATPDNLVAMVKAAPVDVRFYLTVNHEPDDDIKAGTLKESTYAAKMNAFGAAVKGFSNVKFGPIHNGSYGKTAWQADEAGCDRSLWSYWGADRYSPKYEAPSSQFAECRDYAKSLGLPLVLGEVGADPANASAQQTLAAQIHDWTLDPPNGAEVVLWWEQTGYTFANAAVQHAFFFGN